MIALLTDTRVDKQQNSDLFSPFVLSEVFSFKSILIPSTFRSELIWDSLNIFIYKSVSQRSKC